MSSCGCKNIACLHLYRAAAEHFRLAMLFLRLTKYETGKAMRKTSPRQATLAMDTTDLVGDLVDSNRVSHSKVC